MERTPYKNALFVTYAVKAAFDKDPTVPPCILEAVQYAIEDFTQKQARALQLDAAAPAPRGGGAPAPAAANTEWKKRLAEAIDMVMEKEKVAEQEDAPAPLPPPIYDEASSLGGGGDDEEEAAVAATPPATPPAAAPTRRQRFSAEEVRYLRAGVEIHGEGQWAKMIQDPRLKFGACRTAVSLKDKWRNMGAAQKQKKV